MFKRKRRRSRQFKKNEQVIDFEEARQRRQEKRQNVKTSKEEFSQKTDDTKRTKLRKNRRRLVYAAIIFIVVAVIGLSALNILSLQKQQEEVLAENAALKMKKARLAEDLSNVDNPEYIEQEARSKLNLIKPGEKVYILPKQAEEADTKTVTPASVLQEEGQEEKDGDN